MITHKFREVMKFADEVTILRTGKFAGKGLVKDLTPTDMSAMMIGSETTRTAARGNKPRGERASCISTELHALDDIGLKALEDLNLTSTPAKSSASPAFPETGRASWSRFSAGQRKASAGGIKVHGEAIPRTRDEIRKHKVNCLPEEPLKNTCVGRHERRAEHGRCAISTASAPRIRAVLPEQGRRSAAPPRT